ncbi:MAG: homoserine dehydrogenase [Verrucomicrobiales bacterium]
MLELLKQREAEGKPIRVGLIGAGAMGVGIAWQIARTPGMTLAFVGDIKRSALDAAKKAFEPYENPVLTEDCFGALAGANAIDIDVLVEGSNTIGPAAKYCLAAIDQGAHCVLMNAEVDLALGKLLNHEAAKKGVIVTSDAGDQHGVLATMMEEIEMWGFRLVQAGNIKGFLDRYKTATDLIGEAAKRNLDPVQCCAYTDGTKLNVEMALVSNGFGMVPFKPGMEGPACKDVTEVLNLFDFDAYPESGCVDYILGAQPGGGVYVVGHCDDPIQQPYLTYYKLAEKPPYYLFYRPYHLCHLETPRAIAKAVLYGEPVLTPKRGRVADVYAYAKADVAAGTVVQHGIGGDEFYGIIESCAGSDAAGQVPISLLEGEGAAKPKVLADKKKDEPLTFGEVELPDTLLHQLYAEQSKLA